jgi:pimeloyl-ACP methyl ester carboxylesterase
MTGVHSADRAIGKGYDFDTLAGDLAVADARRKNATVVAHSFPSGEVVRYLTLYGGQRIARVVLLAAAAIPFLLKTPDNPSGIEGAIFDQLRHTFAQDFPGWAAANAEPYFVPGTARAVIDWTMRMMTQTSLRAAVELNRIQTSTDFRSELSRIQVPSLLIHGDRDASFPLEVITGRQARFQAPPSRLRRRTSGCVSPRKD